MTAGIIIDFPEVDEFFADLAIREAEDNCSGAASGGCDLWVCSRSFACACEQHHLESDSPSSKPNRVLMSGQSGVAPVFRTHAIGDSVIVRISDGAAMGFLNPNLWKSNGGFDWITDKNSCSEISILLIIL